MVEPLWLSAARKELGVKEFEGPADNPAIAAYWHDAVVEDVAMGQDEVPWCAAFVGAMLYRGGNPGSGKANARSYEKWGSALQSPCLGCVVVISRPPHQWQGHVAFYLGTDRQSRRVRLLGGNQGDAVSIGDFSIDRVVAYRWPSGVPLLAEHVGPLDVARPVSIEPSAA